MSHQNDTSKLDLTEISRRHFKHVNDMFYSLPKEMQKKCIEDTEMTLSSMLKTQDEKVVKFLRSELKYMK